MRCLRTIAGVHLVDRIRNDDIRQSLNITKSINEEVTKRRLTWFGHVMRMPNNRLPLQAYWNDFAAPRPPGCPPLRWRDQIKNAVEPTLEAAENLAMDRAAWRRLTHMRAKGHTVLRP